MSESIISLLNEQQKQTLISSGREVRFCAGETLFRQGDPAEHMYWVEKGKVSLYRLMPNGDEKLFKVFFSGGIVAEMAMFMSPREYPMSARADQDSVLQAYSYKSMTHMAASSPELALKVMGYMSNRICSLMDTLNILTQVNANQRLVMKLAEIYRLQDIKEDKVALPVTKKLLATQLGMTPETLSRAIKRLKNNGYLQESGNSLVLMDIPQLCYAVDLTPDIFGKVS
ncbi:Crp/Fnr family transcriptional regulator [Vibrio sp. HA2012]|uniref:Crp/Fnr family transcriptional regulator n=1 Tax=Vibrio sp. HA2012 TaxID=1971595 RepID=UPI000C2B931C|nr:Crp/Fnr family transcriptional regulator [Vibrio sp. HA2012]PJC86723.1 Crp/Fnr family transcriptional regulator [Vibrio sp. HA2012]